MSAPGRGGDRDELTTALNAALTAGTREAFDTLLTDDVHWGGEHGGNEWTSRDQAGDHYAGLLAAGVTLHLNDLQPTDHADAGDVLTAHL